MINIRRATLEDMDTLVKLRLDFLRHMATLREDDEATLSAQFADYLSRHLNRNALAVLAETDCQVASIALLTVAEQPAHRYLPSGKSGTLLNVYTYPEYRRRGLSIQVVRRTIEEARNMGVSAIDLLATPEGKPLYEQLGFGDTPLPAMRLRIF
ncbi:MAG: GNAT family N-acetyltransferase [Syntrophomonadaceae bacterium]|nr:GNAT family N-acetyltransferase [Syntrophomonadaceae bacterium]